MGGWDLGPLEKDGSIIKIYVHMVWFKDDPWHQQKWFQMSQIPLLYSFQTTKYLAPKFGMEIFKTKTQALHKIIYDYKLSTQCAPSTIQPKMPKSQRSKVSPSPITVFWKPMPAKPFRETVRSREFCTGWLSKGRSIGCKLSILY